ncbi:PREDICTED: putative methyltransferase DDB_G0268948 isoform X2 [Camelina sativa]|uniref:Methyltransferase DDB_G0268948 isoform X2 n=1 Tax=Camelina sativa TaxID=90675 RepID=A0ABM0ZM03_CAMSA|nr:PREDICTED: putative methyltransferase DDB_G0268948 isoform X2 [Camelina sativa]
MAKLFIKQAEQYAAARPNYPIKLFEFIASKTPCHDLAWDVGAGSGQASRSLAGIYKKVIATDTSSKQLEFAAKLPNVRYELTPPTMTTSEIEKLVATESSVDLVTVAQALHWFDLTTFYSNVKHVLKKPNGVIAAWCYTNPEVNAAVDKVFQRFYDEKLGPHWDKARRLVEDGYRGIEFPFEKVDDDDDDDDESTGSQSLPVNKFVTEREMVLEEYMTYLRSTSAYQTAKEKGLEILTAEMEGEFADSWKEDGIEKKIVRFPIHLLIGRVGEGRRV